MTSPSEEAAMVQERVDSPEWYQGRVETIEKIENRSGWPARKAGLSFRPNHQVLRQGRA